MKLSQLRDLVMIAERGSMRNVARDLGITQPAVTRSIRALEHELGAALFERKGKSLVLTPIGETVLQRAIGIHSDIRRIADDVRQSRGEVAGSVSIGLSIVAHVALLPRVTASFQKRYPDVHLDVREGLYPALEADIENGVIDFYIGPMAPRSAPGLIVEELFDNRRLVFGRPGHPLAGATSLRELAGAKWVTDARTPLGADELIAPHFLRHGLPRPRIAANGHSSLSMIILAANSDLLTMLPQQWLDFLETGGLLRRIPIREELGSATICSVRRARLPLTPVAEHLWDLFQKAAANHARSLGSVEGPGRA